MATSVVWQTEERWEGGIGYSYYFSKRSLTPSLEGKAHGSIVPSVALGALPSVRNRSALDFLQSMSAKRGDIKLDSGPEEGLMSVHSVQPVQGQVCEPTSSRLPW